MPAERTSENTADAGRTEGPVRPLLFLHLPKTAGTTLKSIIGQVYGEERAAFLRVGRGDLEAFAARPEAERAGYDVVSGHLQWAERTVLPGASVITMLREPIDRVISWYHYNKTNPHADLYQRLNEHDLSFEDLARRRVLDSVGNQMVAMLADPGAKGPTAMIASAKANLESCVEFGLAEHFDESIRRYTAALNWPEVTWESRNVSKGRMAVGDLDPSTRAMMQQICLADLKLYTHAVRLFESRGSAQAGEAGRG